MFKPAFAVVALLLSGQAFANGLDELRTALSTLQGQGSLRGLYDTRTSTTDKDKAKGTESAAASANVEEDANGVEIRWDRNLLKQAFDQANPPQGVKKQEALQQLINGTSPMKLQQTLNYAPRLLVYLKGATLKAERPETYQGKPARALDLVLQPPEIGSSQVSVKESVVTGTIWINAEGVPLAASVSHKFKGSAMVFLSFEDAAKRDYVFTTVANRLVVLKYEEQGARKNPGGDSTYKVSTTFTPKAG
jgi:hypothetical protein